VLITTITPSTATLAQANVSTIRGIDLIVILILIGLLIFKEFLKLYFDKYGLPQDIKVDLIGRLVNIAIVPFLYIFCYVLIYRALLI
jgi:hypothetical protein